MKKRFVCLLMASVITISAIQTVSASSYIPPTSGTLENNGDISWSFDESAETLTVSGEGEIPYFHLIFEPTPWLPLSSRIKKVVIGEGITSISEGAFHMLTEMTDIYLPSTVTVIRGAFYDCSKLKNVHITDLAAWCGVSRYGTNSNPFRFSEDSALYLNGNIVRELIIPDGVTEIKYSAFSDCASLKSVTVSDSVTVIREQAFARCTGLERAVLSRTTSSIGDSAFYQCTNLNDVTFREGLTKISTFAFAGCGLEELSLPHSLRIIGLGSFESNSKLKSVTIPEGVKVIWQDAFANTPSLEEVTVLSRNVSIGEYAFDSQNPNTVIKGYSGSTAQTAARLNSCRFEPLADTVPTATGRCGNKATWKLYGHELVIEGTGAMYDYFIETTPWRNYSYQITSVHIEHGIDYVGEFSFANCKNLEYLTVPCTVNGFGKSTAPLGINVIGCKGAFAERFARNNDLSYISVRESYGTESNYIENPPDDYGIYWKIDLENEHLTVSGNVSFEYKIPDNYMDYVRKVTVKEGTEYLTAGIFSGCKRLERITLPSTLKTVGANAFAGCEALESISLPQGLQKIESNAFFGSGLKSVIIPESVTEIGEQAFGNCKSLESIFVESDGTVFNCDVFGENSKTVIFASKGSVAEEYAKELKLDFVPLLPFMDVNTSDSYYRHIALSYESGLFNGISETEFAPEASMTRAMLVTVLARFDKADTSAYTESTFTDVNAGEWYTESVGWASANGIVNGMGDGSFGVNSPVTLEQAAVLLYRYAGEKGYHDKVLVDCNGISLGGVSDWAHEGYLFAMATGLTDGYDGLTEPAAPASRALICVMLANLSELLFEVELY